MSLHSLDHIVMNMANKNQFLDVTTVSTELSGVSWFRGKAAQKVAEAYRLVATDVLGYMADSGRLEKHGAFGPLPEDGGPYFTLPHDHDEVERLMKRCQRGCGGRNALDLGALTQLLDGEATPGIPRPVKPDSLYVIFYPPPNSSTSSCTLGAVVRGATANWLYNGIVAHYELPITMTAEQANQFLKSGNTSR